MHPRGAPADEFTTIAEGTLAVTDAVLGQLDPSLLLNGQYDLILQAEDASGNVSSVSRTVLIDEAQEYSVYARPTASEEIRVWSQKSGAAA